MFTKTKQKSTRNKAIVHLPSYTTDLKRTLKIFVQRRMQNYFLISDNNYNRCSFIVKGFVLTAII